MHSLNYSAENSFSARASQLSTELKLGRRPFCLTRLNNSQWFLECRLYLFM